MVRLFLFNSAQTKGIKIHMSKKNTETKNVDSLLNNLTENEKNTVLGVLEKLVSNIGTKNNATETVKLTDKHPGYKPFVFTTSINGVYFGYGKVKDDGVTPDYQVTTAGTNLVKSIRILEGRHCFYWATKTGFLELAESGPKTGSKIGATANGTLEGITSAWECTELAVETFAKTGWSK